MKKAVGLILALVIMIAPMFYVPKVEAETLGDMKKELNNLEDKLAKTEAKKAETQEEINTVNNNITKIKGEISQTYKDIDSLTEQIEELNKKIKKADKEIKDIISLLQVANGESAYLEYVSGAETWEGFIYRVAMSEQLSDNNDKKIKEFNNMIDQNKKKQKEITGKRVTLSNKQEELKDELAKLGKEMEKVTATSISQEDDIKAQKEIINTYKKMGCKDNETIKACIQRTTRKASGTVPVSGSVFYRPLVSGTVSSEWGPRWGGFHEGIDLSVGQGTTAYSIGVGVVATTMHRQSCGGNMVVVHYNIGGRTFTAVYAHLVSIAVSQGQIVTQNTVIGYTGGGPSTQAYNPCTGAGGPGWDRCSCGQHLHLTVANGLYGEDYKSWSQLNYTYSINPRNVINFPGTGGSFYDRVSRY